MTCSARTAMAVIGLALFVCSCVLTIDPVISESDATFDARLLGQWEDSSSKERATVSRGGENSYLIDYRSEKKTTRFSARLGHLGNHLVLELWPTGGGDGESGLDDGLLIAGHMLLTVSFGTDEIRLKALAPDLLLAALQAGYLRLTCTYTGGRVELHGTTEELREALGPYLSSSGALEALDVWRRPTHARPLNPVEPPCFEASSWREADRLFQRDPHWLGGDCASSVDLGDGRILWLFGDSWIDPTGRRSRGAARMVSNSVGIQRGTDPSRASMRMYWGRAADGSPAALIPDSSEERHWFGNGIRVGDRLVLFVNRVIGTTSGLGFESVGWAAWLVENPDANPDAWRLRQLETPGNRFGILVGFAAVQRLGDWVYAYGSENPVKSHPIYAVRWPAEEVRRGNLLHPEWWAGDMQGWVHDSSSAQRWPIFENGQSELTIHVDPKSERFLSLQTRGFGAADVVMRAAPTLTGPWSRPRLIYRPPEYYRPNAMIYSAKAHPELTGADLVVTYATNTFELREMNTDSLIYYPRFVRLTRCR